MNIGSIDISKSHQKRLSLHSCMQPKELPALHPDGVRLVGLLLDGHRVGAGEDQPRGRHPPSNVVAGRTR